VQAENARTGNNIWERSDNLRYKRKVAAKKKKRIRPGLLQGMGAREVRVRGTEKGKKLQR